MLLSEISQNKNIRKPVIYGIAGTSLLEEEKIFFKKAAPIGFILFARNIEDKAQLKSLTNEIRELMDGEILILIDQEGGRVARMTEPHWKKYPSGKHFADLYEIDQKLAKTSLYKNFQEIASDLEEVGINVDCAPVLDILTPQTHKVIGDRAYGDEAGKVCDLASEVCKGLLSRNVYPVIKHIPGHGRGSCDSHLELPVVDASLVELRKSDFLPFIHLKNQKFAMSAHILYKAIDENNCATTSKVAIDLIRNEIGFKNILMSDDVSMKALGGSFASRTKAIFEAGCDLILHCNGNMKEMQEIDSATQEIKDNFWEIFTK